MIRSSKHHKRKPNFPQIDPKIKVVDLSDAIEMKQIFPSTATRQSLEVVESLDFAVDAFRHDGVIPFNFRLSHENKRKLKKMVDKNTNYRRLNGRLGGPIEINNDNIDFTIWRQILTPAMTYFITKVYGGCEPYVCSLEIIQEQANTPRQKNHRDHGEGKFQSIAVGFKLDTDDSRYNMFGTRIYKGSHQFRGMSEKNADDEAEMIQLNHPNIIFDGFSIHGAGEGKRDDKYRLFVTFITADPSKEGDTHREGIYNHYKYDGLKYPLYTIKELITGKFNPVKTLVKTTSKHA